MKLIICSLSRKHLGPISIPYEPKQDNPAKRIYHVRNIVVFGTNLDNRLLIKSAWLSTASKHVAPSRSWIFHENTTSWTTRVPRFCVLLRFSR